MKLDTDASSVGLGAVLSHIMPNGEERPIEFISRTLSAAERNYAQIDREALGIVWGVKRFHLYLYGRKFLLRTDHKPLVHIIGAKKMPDMGTSRIIRWALFLMEYDYEIIYRKTSEHSNCDMLSRLPVTTKHTEDEDLNAVVCALNLETTCIDAETIRVETKKDPVLSKIATFILDGWPITSPDSEMMIAYWRRKDELSMELGCVLWGARVIIPTKLKQFVLEMLHLTHPGSPGMKNLSRSYVWWPSMNNDIDNLVRTCETCSKHSKSAPTVGEHPWSKPQGPWQRVHMDFAGPFAGFMWLVLQCAYSKWPEVAKMQSTSAPKLIKELRNIFARTGIPCVCVSDNGPQFTLDTLDKFMKTNRIKHILTPTYHPKSNGLAERLVGSFKHSMKKMLEENGDVDQNMSNFLLRYRNTPHSKTRIEPAVLMYGRTLRSALHFIRPSDRERAELLQADKEQKVADELPKVRQFHPKQLILVQKNDDKTWSKGVVIARHGDSNVYDIECEGRVMRKHVDHLKTRAEPIVDKGKYSPYHRPDLLLGFDSSNRALDKPTVVQGTEFSKPNVVQGTNKPKVVDQDTVSSKEETDKKPTGITNKMDPKSMLVQQSPVEPKLSIKPPVELRRSERIK